MLKTEYTFHNIVGTHITAKNVAAYTEQLLKLFNVKAKIERNHKRKVERLNEAAIDVVKITDFLLNHAKIKELADLESESIEQVLFLASDLDITKRTKVINYIMKLNKAELDKAAKKLAKQEEAA